MTMVFVVTQIYRGRGQVHGFARRLRGRGHLVQVKEWQTRYPPPAYGGPNARSGGRVPVSKHRGTLQHTDEGETVR